MNSEKYVIVQNLLGKFMHAWYENCMSSCVESIFTTDAKLNIPERNVSSKGINSIKMSFQNVEEYRNQFGDFRDIHLTHSPSYCELRDGTCLLACDTYSFEPCKENRLLINKIEYFITRINIKCKYEDNVMKIYSLFWREVQGITPWDWDAAKNFAAFRVGNETVPHPTAPIKPEDYLPVRNLATRFTQHNRKDAAEDFVRTEDCIFDIPVMASKQEGYKNIEKKFLELEQLEKENDNMYICIPTLGSPYLYMEDDCAVSSWTSMTFGIKASACGNSSETAQISRSVGRTKIVCKKESTQWKIKSYIYEPAYGFDDIKWTPSDRYNVMQCEENNWRDGPEKTSGGTMADVAEIENMIADWIYGQRFCMPDYMSTHMDIKNPDDLMVLITGSTREPDIGFKAVKERLVHPQANDVGVFDNRDKTPGYHTGSTPLVEISSDGEKAEGVWIDFAMVDVGGYMGLPRYPKRYMITVGRYFHKFIKEDGKWKQYFVGWDPLINMPDMLYNPDECRGWICRQNTPFVFPPMFENFDED